MRLPLVLYLPPPPPHTHTNYNEKLCSGVASLSRCLNVELVLLVLVNHSALALQVKRSRSHTATGMVRATEDM